MPGLPGRFRRPCVVVNFSTLSVNGLWLMYLSCNYYIKWYITFLVLEGQLVE